VTIPKKFLIFLVIVIVTLTGITISLNFIIRSDGVQEKLQQQVQKILGVPVKIEKISFNPFTGFHLSRITITTAANSSVDASSINFMPSWKSLLSSFWEASHMKKWGGMLRVSKVTLNNNFSIRHLKAHLRKKSDSFVVDPFSSEVAGGQLNGSFLMQQENNLSPYQLNLSFSKVALKELLKGMESIEGTLQGTFFMKGILEDSNKKEGEGALAANGMQFKPGGALAQIGKLLGIEELQLLKFDEAVATYAVTPRDLVIKSFKLHSNNLMIRGHGAISFEGMIHINALLLVNAKLQSRLQGLLPVSLLVPSGEVGFVAIPFEINGSLDHPHSTLLEHVPLPAINSNVQGVIRQLLKF